MPKFMARHNGKVFQSGAKQVQIDCSIDMAIIAAQDAASTRLPLKVTNTDLLIRDSEDNYSSPYNSRR